MQQLNRKQDTYEMDKYMYIHTIIHVYIHVHTDSQD
jgi:hypothetical protein